MSRLQRWWREPDRFDWTTEFLAQRGLLRSAQTVLASVSGSAALVPLTFLGSLRSPPVTLVALGVVGAILTVGMTAVWLTRWPTRRQSAVAIVTGTLFVAIWSLCQPTAAVSLLACTATAVTGGYIAFFHSTKLLVFNFVVAVAITTTASWRLAAQEGVGTAVAAFWLILFLNSTVPVAIRGMARAMGAYAMRSDADPLTGLLNRRGFADRVFRQIRTSQDAEGHLALVMVDLDDFKRVNDTHGHAAGDRALTAVAELLRQHSPSNAAICRAGGEEFLIAVSTDPGHTDPLAAQLCAAIAALPHEVTASIGISTMPLETLRSRDTGPRLDDLIAAADAAMYAAKRNGGNQVKHQ
ncbi:putative signaling protein [Mycolicibacterium vanbaalenii]|uniref:Putative signaling protein n=1 Tax=Mycolicibacterium vanbaalenii TaxID=110539 RepID=A0A5S9R8B4_MYCVN|nr:sensor domain-containing diguanylate cyclase [Mycolicibacterium vanbaalenii]CAA0134483.1 putative signaling protein [Mycolicibacterium vanbaalenii]